MSEDDNPTEKPDRTAWQIPTSAVKITQQGETDVYIIPAADTDARDARLVLAYPFEDGVLLGGTSTAPAEETGGLSVEYGAYRTYSLTDVSQIRDDHERVRDQIRHDRAGDRPREQVDVDVLQEFIDLLVIVEHACKFLNASDRSDDRDRHYRRISALCEDPQNIIENVEDALDGTKGPRGLLDQLRNTVRSR